VEEHLWEIFGKSEWFTGKLEPEISEPPFKLIVKTMGFRLRFSLKPMLENLGKFWGKMLEHLGKCWEMFCNCWEMSGKILPNIAKLLFSLSK